MRDRGCANGRGLAGLWLRSGSRPRCAPAPGAGLRLRSGSCPRCAPAPGAGLQFANHGLPHSAGVRLFDCGAARPSGGVPLLPLLAAQAELLNQGLVAIGARTPEIIQQAPPLAHELQQAAAGMMILCVRLEVDRQLIHAFGDQRDLHFGRARVATMGAM